jgi:hypothetical protein
MTEQPQRNVSTANRIVATLRELIKALDRRVPHVDRPGEPGIARDAQMLRRQAIAQIDALSRLEPDGIPYDQELVDAIMTDDGCPSPESETNRQSSGKAWKRSSREPTPSLFAMAGRP